MKKIKKINLHEASDSLSTASFISIFLTRGGAWCLQCETEGETMRCVNIPCPKDF